MASVTFPLEYGGDGNTYTDDADPDTGLDGLGYTVRFIPALQQAVAMVAYSKQQADAASGFADECQALRNQAAQSASDAATARDAAQQARQDAEALYQDLSAVENAKNESQQSATASQNSRLASEAARDGSQLAETNAKAARDAAQLAAGVFGDTAQGLAATTDGDYFSVPDPAKPEVFLALYRNDAGAAVLVETYPTAAYMDESVQVTYAQRATIITIEQRIRWKYDLDPS